MKTSQEAVNLLVDLGKKKGFVTYGQIFSAIADCQTDPTQLDKFLGILEEQGIEIIDEEEQEN